MICHLIVYHEILQKPSLDTLSVCRLSPLFVIVLVCFAQARRQWRHVVRAQDLTSVTCFSICLPAYTIPNLHEATAAKCTDVQVTMRKFGDVGGVSSKPTAVVYGRAL